MDDNENIYLALLSGCCLSSAIVLVLADTTLRWLRAFVFILGMINTTTTNNNNNNKRECVLVIHMAGSFSNCVPCFAPHLTLLRTASDRMGLD